MQLPTEQHQNPIYDYAILLLPEKFYNSGLPDIGQIPLA